MAGSTALRVQLHQVKRQIAGMRRATSSATNQDVGDHYTTTPVDKRVLMQFWRDVKHNGMDESVWRAKYPEGHRRILELCQESQEIRNAG